MQRTLISVLLLNGLVAGAASLPKKILFLVQGGYDSCSSSSRSDLPPLGMKMVPPFLKMLSAVSKVDPAFTPLVITGCLDTDPPPSGYAQFVVPDRPKNVVYGPTSKLQSELTRMVLANPDAPIVFIGHSYGAWMAMHLALKPAFKRIALLVTLDPIGPECGPLGVVFGDSACHNAPTDLDNRSIGRKSDKWINFYQEDDSWLSSSEIAGAENYAVDVTWGPHSDINRNTRVWSVIQKAVIAALPR
jgi:hypothetical protein